MVKVRMNQRHLSFSVHSSIFLRCVYIFCTVSFSYLDENSAFGVSFVVIFHIYVLKCELTMSGGGFRRNDLRCIYVCNTSVCILCVCTYDRYHDRVFCLGTHVEHTNQFHRDGVISCSGVLFVATESLDTSLVSRSESMRHC